MYPVMLSTPSGPALHAIGRHPWLAIRLRGNGPRDLRGYAKAANFSELRQREVRREKNCSEKYAVAISQLHRLGKALALSVLGPMVPAPANVATNEARDGSKLWRLATDELPENFISRHRELVYRHPSKGSLRLAGIIRPPPAKGAHELAYEPKYEQNP
jgi:hypothetical protein